MKLFNTKANAKLDWNPHNWGDGNKPIIGPYEFDVKPLPNVAEAKSMLEKNRSDMADVKVCFDQVTYNAYLHAFKKFAAHEPVFFVGPPGTCKTFVVSKLSSDVGIPMLKVPALDMDPVRARRILFGGLTTSDEAPWKILEHRAYAGTLVPKEQAEVDAYSKGKEMKSDDWKLLADKLGYVSSVAHFEPGAVTKGARHGYIVFIDELNKFTPAALTDLTQLLSGQSIQLENGEWISMRDSHPNFRLAFAMNQAGPLHPDREPLVRELMSRLSRHMMIIPEMDAKQEEQFLMFQWTGEQPTVKLPDGHKFSAKPFQASPVFKNLVGSSNTKALRDFADKYIKARATSRETSRKMESGENSIPREHTTETWPYDRRDLVSFSKDVLEVFEIAEDSEMARTMFHEVIDRHCSQHFLIYNLQKGPDVIQEFNENVTKAGLYTTFDNLLSTMINVHTVESAKNDPAALDDNVQKLAKMLDCEFTDSAKTKPCHIVKVSKSPDHPGRKADINAIQMQAKLVESLLLAQKKITKTDVDNAVAELKTGYPLGLFVFDDTKNIEGFILKYPEFKGKVTAGETAMLTMPKYLKELIIPALQPKVKQELS